jgi:maltose-binding protein MalE
MASQDEDRGSSDNSGYDRRFHITKRGYLKAAGATGVTGISALAGCTGDSSSGSGSPTEGGGSTEREVSNGSQQFSGTTLSWWNVGWAVIGEVMKNTAQNIIQQVEQETGATIKPNWSSTSALIGPKWQNTFQNGEYPVLFDAVAGWAGPFMDQGYVKPFSEYKHLIDQEALDNMQWILEKMKPVYSGYDGELYEIPYMANVIEPFVGRMDHFKQAGLDPEKDFPPKNYEHLIQVAKTLEEDGPANSGYTVYGESSDSFDEQILTWSVAAGGTDGLYLNQDWTEAMMTNDVWQEWGTKYIEVFSKHDIGPRDTPSLSVEAAIPRMANGRISMLNAAALNLPIFKKNMPELINNGTLQWAPSWMGDADYSGKIGGYTMALTRKPERASKQEWENQTKVAAELINYMLQKDVQKKIYNKMGALPVRKDVWDEIKWDRPDNFGTAFKNMAETSGPSYGAHPLCLPIIVEIAPPHMQKALRGDTAPRQALNNIASDINSQL